MTSRSPGHSFALAVAATVTLGAAPALRAQSPYEIDQRQQMERAQQNGTLSPDAQKLQRWQQEWRQTHPGEPMPNMGQLEKLHRGEIINTMNQDWARSRELRQQELKRNYLLSRQNQAQINARQHITWTAQQWNQWDARYIAQQKQDAQDYLKAAALSGEMARQEHEREEQEKLWKNAHE